MPGGMKSSRSGSVLRKNVNSSSIKGNVGVLRNFPGFYIFEYPIICMYLSMHIEVDKEVGGSWVIVQFFLDPDRKLYIHC